MKISRLITTDGRSFEPVKKGELIQKEKCYDGTWMDECTVEHLGGGRYLIGYCKNNNGNYETENDQCLINTWIILFPNMINTIELKNTQK